MDHELHPQRVIVGSETNPKQIAANWELVREHPPRDRRLHLDRLGLPRRVGHRRRCATSRDPPTRPADSWRRTRGSPPTAATSTSPGSAARSRTGGRSCGVCAPRPTSRCGRPRTTARSRRSAVGWSFTDAIAIVVVARVRGPAGHGRGVRRRRRGRAADERRLRRSCDGRRDASVRGRVRDDLHARRARRGARIRDGAETGRVSLASASGPVHARRAGRPPHASTPTDRDLAYVDDRAGRRRRQRPRARTAR